MKAKTTPKYIPKSIESKWQEKWEQSKIYQPDMDSAKRPFYNLMMFPYPSAEGMHVGNMYAFTGSDIYGRFKRMQGFDVFEPMGLDGFGIHSENYALKIGKHPKEQAKVSQANFYRQLKATGNAFDWSRTLETYDPSYYKWTQWIFIKLFEAGLAYKKKADVNFCPSCKTVLADEQVIDGKCERCSTEVEKKALEQWFFKITQYADRLLNNIEGLDWSEKVKIAQRQWIGKKEGITITYAVVDSKETIAVFTTRPDTNFGATFIAVAPEHPLVMKLTTQENKKAVEAYIATAKKKTQIERTNAEKEKTGVFTGSYAINQLTGYKMPIWVSDFVLMGFGTGALVGVPGHDKRDFQFATTFGLDIKRVVVGNDGDTSEITSLEQVQEDEGNMVNSGFLDGLDIHVATEKIMDYMEEKGYGKKETTYHLRDWLISRQRYWGPPIPLIHCEKDGWVPVPEKELPVLLPDVSEWKPLGTGKSPLASVDSFVNTTCPKCGGKATRETDVSDTFLDSSWYFFRYTSTEKHDEAWDPKRAKKWLPVTMYIGGAEHSVLHLLYSRFLTMVFKDLGLCEFEEPFAKFRAHGLLVKDGAKMSKSKGNVVIPDVYIGKFGADTLRSYLMFAGPYDQGGDFRDTGIEGMHRFLRKVWVMVQDGGGATTSPELDREMSKAIKEVSEDMERLHYNTAIAHIMEYYNALSKHEGLDKKYLKSLVQLLAPFAPHVAEELWEVLGEKFSVHTTAYPSFDESLLVQNEVTIVVQVNGKLRDNVVIPAEKAKDQKGIEELARESEKVTKYFEGKEIKKTIYVPGKIINFVV